MHTGGACVTLEQLEERLKFVEEQPGVLFDRCSHISNGIYASVLGRDEFLDEHHMAQRLLDFHPVVVYCRLRGPNAQSRMLANMIKSEKPHKPKDYTLSVQANHDKLVAEYDRRMGNLAGVVPIITYDYSVDTFEDLVSTLREFAIVTPDEPVQQED